MAGMGAELSDMAEMGAELSDMGTAWQRTG